MINQIIKKIMRPSYAKILKVDEVDGKKILNGSDPETISGQ